MRALFIQQDHVSPTGPIGEAFADRGYDIDHFVVVPADQYPNPHVEVTFPDPLQYDVIIPMGAIWAVYDHHVIDWINDELALLRQAHDAGVPLFGICFGGQSVAAALGGSVHMAPEREVGWTPLKSTRPDLVDGGPWFEWHQDRWVPPPGATTIASTAKADQAFVIGRSMALQFHPEVVYSTLTGWLGNGGYAELEEHGHDVEAMLAQTKEIEADAAFRARRLVNRFLDQVAIVEL
jgi:GMP synthase-like glutamine amidotransferase